jgi:hypothetical protein
MNSLARIGKLLRVGLCVEGGLWDGCCSRDDLDVGVTRRRYIQGLLWQLAPSFNVTSCTGLHCVVLNFVLQCTALYCTVLYRTVLYRRYGFVVPGEDADQQHHESFNEQESVLAFCQFHMLSLTALC